MNDASILVFAFKGTVAETVAGKLESVVQIYIVDSSMRAIDELTIKIQQQDPNYILGMGMYSGRDKDRLRIEKYCSSQFRDDKNTLEQLTLPHFIRQGDYIKEAAGIGNSWCNLVSYRIMKEINPNHFTFLHIPKSFDVNKAAKLIDKQLETLRYPS